MLLNPNYPAVTYFNRSQQTIVAIIMLLIS